VLQLIGEQMSQIEQRVDALLLVGGFAGSEYLRQRVQVRLLIDFPSLHLFKSLEHFSSKEQFGTRVRVIARPPDADTATLRGAAQYGLARRPLVASVIAPRAYIMKVC
jgi:hypothetical protein